MRLSTLLGRARVEREMDAELRFHIEREAEENVKAGMDPEAARRAALRATGSVAMIKEECRASLGVRLLDNLRQDVQLGLRGFAKNPGFTIIAVLTLALGIGANAAIFTLLDGIMFKPLVVPAPAELIALYENGREAAPDAAGGTGRYLRFSYPRFTSLAASIGERGSIAAVTRSSPFVLTLPGSGDRRHVSGQLASGNFFGTLRVSAARGRLLTPLDESSGAPVAVASERFWRRTLGASESAVGQAIVLNGVSITLVGVAQAGFVGLWSDSEADVWVPVTLQQALRYQTNSSSYAAVDSNQPWVEQDQIAWLNVLGRVHAEDLPAAYTALTAANRQGVSALTAKLPPGDWMQYHTLGVEPFARGFSGLRNRYGAALAALAGMVAIVLLVTCVNIANLLMIRGVSRSRELGIRAALGATTGRLVRQAMTESVMLAAAGGVAGFAVGRWLSRALALQVLGAANILPAVFEPDARVLAFTAAMSILTAVVFGIGPALRAARSGRRSALGGGDRSAVAQSPIRAMSPLVVAQLALSMIVVFGAVLLGRTLFNFARVDPGFDVPHILSASFDLAPGSSDPSVAGRSRRDALAVGDRLLAAARSVPGVTSAVLSRCGLVAGCASSSGFTFEGGKTGTAFNNWVGPRYFATVGIRLIEGREFDEQDTAGRPTVAIVSESIARRYFPGESAVGRHVGKSEIIGVVKDARSMTVHDPPVSMIYFPMDDASFSRLPVIRVEARTGGAAGVLLPAFREAVRRADPSLVAEDITTVSALVSHDLTRERLVAYLAASFALLAIFLAAMGLYGTLSYGVACRTKEIGVRMALGAARSQVALLVLRQSAVLAVAGLALGAAGSVIVARFLQDLLFGLPPLSPSAFAAAAGVFGLVAAVASYLPARRAARVDPLVALRAE